MVPDSNDLEPVELHSAEADTETTEVRPESINSILINKKPQELVSPMGPVS